MNRTEFVKLLPMGKIGAEIGVLRGDFSAKLLGYAIPDVLFLIDAWQHQDSRYVIDPCNVEQIEQDKRYAGVCKRFERLSNVKIIRKFSVEAAKLFDDEFFDWIYLDACHLRECVIEDMEAYWPKLKFGGLFAGHDYMMKGHVEVKEAVDDFLGCLGLKVQLMSDTTCPDWMVKKP